MKLEILIKLDRISSYYDEKYFINFIEFYIFSIAIVE